jgi:hypothetical protein
MNTIDIPALSPVAPGSRAISKLSVGQTYHGILFKLSTPGNVGDSFVKSDLKMITLMVNNTKKLFEIPGLVLKAVCDYDAGTDDATMLLLDLTEKNAKDLVSELYGVLGTGEGITDVTLMVDIANTAVNPILECTALVSGPTPVSDHVEFIERITTSWGAAKEWTLDLPHGPSAGRMIKRLYLMSPNISKLRLKKNGVEIWTTDVDRNAFLQREYGSVPDVANMHVLDFALTDNTIAELLTVWDAQSLQLLVTTTAATNMDVYLHGYVNINEL